MSHELNVRCVHCTRFINIKAVQSSEIEVRCTDRKCKQWNKIKVVMLTDYYDHNHDTHTSVKP